MLFQVGGEGARPTFFEMVAAQQLPTSLRAALSYSLGVLALRRPFIHKILDFDDEFFAMLMMVLESHSLRTNDASFSESLYGLRRRASIALVPNINASNDDSNDNLHRSCLARRQKVLSVVFLVVLPYFKSKLHSIHNKEREARLQESLWGHDDGRMDNIDYVFHHGVFSQTQVEVSTMQISNVTNFKKRVMKIVGVLYPWLHVTSEGISFAYQLLYLLDATGYFTLGLHALGIHVCRATGQELMDSSSRLSRNRSHELERLRGPPWLKSFQRAVLSCVYTTLDYAQTGLIAAVFVFKMMEWWYQSAEERMAAPTVYPPPPSPPHPKVADDGIPLPPDRTICPLCSQKRVNPSVLAISGFVFCYSCIFKYVSQYKRCPVTLLHASVEQIRRLFHDL